MGLNKPVDFPTAKLLKEKGFDEPCKLCVEEGDERPLPFNCGNTIHRNSLHPYYSAPTIAEVVMWLYEKHGVWIHVMKYKDHSADVNSPYEFTWNMGKTTYKTPTEAYEAAILYCLKENLLER
jgi:hypothetical protein